MSHSGACENSANMLYMFLTKSHAFSLVNKMETVIWVCLPGVIILSGRGRQREGERLSSFFEMRAAFLTCLDVHSPLFLFNKSVFVLPYHVRMHIGHN